MTRIISNSKNHFHKGTNVTSLAFIRNYHEKVSAFRAQKRGEAAVADGVPHLMGAAMASGGGSKGDEDLVEHLASAIEQQSAGSKDVRVCTLVLVKYEIQNKHGLIGE